LWAANTADTGHAWYVYIIPALVGAVIIFAIVKFVSQWVRNNNSPRITVPVYIVSKYRIPHEGHDVDSPTTYTNHVVFEIENAERIELRIPSKIYNFMVEGDYGNLTFQGTRFISFERTVFIDEER